MPNFKREVEGALERVEQQQAEQQLESEEYWEQANLGAKHLDKMNERIVADAIETGEPSGTEA